MLLIPSVSTQPRLDNESIPDMRLIPNAIDERARTNPNAVFASIPISSCVADGFRDVTYSEYANAINHAASWLENVLGESASGEKIGYIAPSDLRYVILAVAAVKVDRQVKNRIIHTGE